MTHRPGRRARQTPVQPRAQETRDRLLDAAARVFARHGYRAGTTNRIAAEAGMSIGTLYRYFPNKDALVGELARIHALESVGATERTLTELPATVEDAVRTAARTAVDAHVGWPRLHRVLFEEAPLDPDFGDEVRAVEDRLVDQVAALLAAEPTVTVADPELAARVAVVVIDALVNRLIAHDPPQADPDVLVEEIVVLLATYLTAPPRSRGSSPSSADAVAPTA